MIPRSGARLLWIVLGLWLAGCGGAPDTYAPPTSRRPVLGFGAGGFGGIVSMNDPSAPAHIVKDIGGVEAGSWRWAYKHPELRFALTKSKGVRFAMDFAVPKVTFDQTGPVTISFYANGNLLDTVRYAEPGDKHFEKAVPPEWLQPDRMISAAAEIDKMYKSPQDGMLLGFILRRAGFVE